MRFKQPNSGKDTKTVQSIITIDTARKLRNAAKRRNLSDSAFIAAAIEKQLDEVEVT